MVGISTQHCALVVFFTFLESFMVLLAGWWRRSKAGTSLGRVAVISASAQFQPETMT